jgi:hypothetical protein
MNCPNCGRTMHWGRTFTLHEGMSHYTGERRNYLCKYCMVLIIWPEEAKR